MDQKTPKQEVHNDDFTQILNKINRKFQLLHVSWKEEKQFEIKFRTEIEKNNDDYNALCDKWVDIFSKVTDTVWVKKTSNTGRKVKFRKQYQCWTHGGKIVQKELLFDARKCKGTLDIKVFCDDNICTRRKNKFFKLGLNVVVKMNFHHLHNVDTKKPFAFFVHNCSSEVKNVEETSTVCDTFQQTETEHILSTSSLALPKICTIQSTPDSDDDRLAQTETLPVGVAFGMQPPIQGNIFMPMRNENHVIQDNQNMNDSFQLVETLQPQCINGLKFYYQSGVDQLTQVVFTDSALSTPLLINPPTFDNMQPIPYFMQASPAFLCNQTQFLK